VKMPPECQHGVAGRDIQHGNQSYPRWTARAGYHRD
jgi:hypothetical protein